MSVNTSDNQRGRHQPLRATPWQTTLVLWVTLATSSPLAQAQEEAQGAALPDAVRRLVEQHVPGVVIREHIAEPEAGGTLHEYRIEGVREGKEIALEIDVSPEGELHEIEIKYEPNATKRRLRDSEAISVSRIPTAVLQAAVSVLPGLQPMRAKIGAVGGMTAYEIEGLTGRYLVEIKIRNDGQVLEVEKKPYR